MKHLISILIGLVMLTSTNASAQTDSFFSNLYKDFLKYGTLYGAGDINNSIEAAEPTYFLRTNPDGSLYSIPEVVDNTPVYPFENLQDLIMKENLKTFMMVLKNN